MRPPKEDSGPSPPAPDLSETIPSVVLLARIREGSDEAREALVRRYWPRLERWARGRLPAAVRDLYDTGDLVQETMLAVLRRLEDFDPQHDGALPAYFRIAILNRIRTLATRTRARAEVDLRGDVPAGAPSPLEDAVGREALELYERALSRLRPDDRQVIQLRVELNLSYPDLAAELGKPTVTAARMAVSRALYRLALEMGRDV